MEKFGLHLEYIHIWICDAIWRRVLNSLLCFAIDAICAFVIPKLIQFRFFPSSS